MHVLGLVIWLNYRCSFTRFYSWAFLYVVVSYRFPVVLVIDDDRVVSMLLRLYNQERLCAVVRCKTLFRRLRCTNFYFYFFWDVTRHVFKSASRLLFLTWICILWCHDVMKLLNDLIMHIVRFWGDPGKICCAHKGERGFSLIYWFCLSLFLRRCICSISLNRFTVELTLASLVPDSCLFTVIWKQRCLCLPNLLV